MMKSLRRSAFGGAAKVEMIHARFSHCQVLNVRSAGMAYLNMMDSSY